ncbi:protein translocase subunit SecF [Georgenia sp. H159]|uniref:protein translocase subunit SecF n=1 Tax=Georgenia sp. H159 TaxID=3076115 RepID=UPI002D78E4A2|nr:protein translocase subunit SecF [Georgenia sp. H159]
MTSLAQLGNQLHTGERSIPFVQRRRTWFMAAAALVLLSVLLVAFKGINLGIEFRGGSQFTVSGTEKVEEQPAHDVVAELGDGQVARVATVGSSSVRVQTQELTTDQTEELRQALAEAYEVPDTDVTSTFIGPSWGQDITRQALLGLVVFVVLVAIVLSAYFRSWQMATAALVGLLHDIVVTVGVYALIGWEVTPATVIGLLTILGYSLYDTVVVFDKVRENTLDLAEQHDRTYSELSNLAVNQTLVRSINTSLTSLLPVGSILFVGALLLGAGTLRDIALALFVGMFVSTVSSIFVATPLQVALHERGESVRAHTEDVLARRRRTSGSEDVRVVLEEEATLTAGQHRGQAAQPKRRKGRR